MIESIVLLVSFTVCQDTSCKSPVVKEVFKSNIACHKEMDRRVEKEHGILSCIIATQRLDNTMPVIVKPFSKIK